MNFNKIFLITIMSGSLTGCSLPPCPPTAFYPDTLPKGIVGKYYSAKIYNVGFSSIKIKNGLGEANSQFTREVVNRWLARSPDGIYFPDHGLTYVEGWDKNSSRPIIEITGTPIHPINHELMIKGEYPGRICDLNAHSSLSKKYTLKIEAD